MKNNQKNNVSRRDLLGLLGAAGLGLAVTNTVSPTVEAQTVSPTENLQGAGFYQFKVGDFECAVVSDGVLNLKPEEFFINPKPEVEKILREEFLPTDNVTLQINTLIVKTGKNIALMDTGVGNYAGQSGGHLFGNLKRVGISPNEITDVFISHAHFDHISGNYNEQKMLNFPKATFHLSQAEWTAATREKDFFGEAKAPETLKNLLLEAIRKNLAPLKDRVKLFSADAEIIPGISAVTAYGHTPGHSTYLVKSGDDSLLYVGDLIHHRIQLAAPQIQMNGNSFLKEAAVSRQKILSRLASEKTRMMAAHFPYPGIGNIRLRDAKSQSYEWIPIEWQW